MTQLVDSARGPRLCMLCAETVSLNERDFPMPSAGIHRTEPRLKKETAMAHASIVTSDARVEVDGLRIFVRFWRPNGKVRGVITIVPGFNAHSGYYTSVAEQFAEQGLAVYALDLRGRGHSDGERFYIEKITDYVRDVE